MEVSVPPSMESDHLSHMYLTASGVMHVTGIYRSTCLHVIYKINHLPSSPKELLLMVGGEWGKDANMDLKYET